MGRSSCEILHSGEQYQGLANAIVFQAAQDYRRDLRSLKRGYSLEVSHEKEKIEKFFHSAWFGVLTKIDPDYLLKRLQKEVEDGEKNE